MPFTTFVTKLNIEESASKQEEFLRPNCTIDTKYVESLIEGSITEAKFRGIINSVLGRVIFERQNKENEVSIELFKQHYVFGTFPNTRGWIGYFDRVLGLVLTREKLYEYLTPETKVYTS